MEIKHPAPVNGSQDRKVKVRIMLLPTLPDIRTVQPFLTAGSNLMMITASGSAIRIAKDPPTHGSLWILTRMNSSDGSDAHPSYRLHPNTLCRLHGGLCPKEKPGTDPFSAGQYIQGKPGEVNEGNRTDTPFLSPGRDHLRKVPWDTRDISANEQDQRRTDDPCLLTER